MLEEASSFASFSFFNQCFFHPPNFINMEELPHTAEELLRPFAVRDEGEADAPRTVPFFDQDAAVAASGEAQSAIAMDVSGSTSGSVLNASKHFLREILGPQNDATNAISNRCIGWSHFAQVGPLDQFRSTGGTDPAPIFDVAPRTLANLVVTTDGEIPSVGALRVRLARQQLTNVVAVLVSPRGYREREDFRVAHLNVSVFSPFMEQAERRNGVFYLFHVFSDEMEAGMSARLIMRRLPNANANVGNRDGVPADFDDGLPAPPAAITEESRFEEFPLVKLTFLSKLRVPAPPRIPNEGEVYVAGLETPMSIRTAELLDYIRRHPAVASSDGFHAFITEHLDDTLKFVADLKTAEALRELVKIWQDARLAISRAEIQKLLEADVGGIPISELRKAFVELTEKRAKGTATEEERKRLAEVTLAIAPVISEQRKREAEANGGISGHATRLMQILATMDARNGLQFQTPEDFSLAAVACMGNRARRAAMVQAPTAQESWTMEGCLVCPECSICGRENQPRGLLLCSAGDISQTLLVNNLGDHAANDPLSQGALNGDVIPAFDVCCECAFSVMASFPNHPMSGKKIAAVLPCVDLSKGSNLMLTHSALCTAFFEGKAMPYAWAFFIGAFASFSDKGRFPADVVNSIFRQALYSTQFNLVAGSSCFRRQEPYPFEKKRGPYGAGYCLMSSMLDLQNLFDGDRTGHSWEEQLRNKSVTSLALIVRCIAQYERDLCSADKCVGMVRRLILKNFITAVLTAGKRSAVALRDIRRAIECDLFKTPSVVPLMGSARLAHIDKSLAFSVALSKGNRYRTVEALKTVSRALFGEESVDRVMPPAVYTAALCLIYRRLALQGRSACLVRPEAALRDLFGIPEVEEPAMMVRYIRRGGRRVRVARSGPIAHKRLRGHVPSGPVAAAPEGDQASMEEKEEEKKKPELTPEELELQTLAADAFFIGSCSTVTDAAALHAIDLVSPYRGAQWAPDHSDLPVFAPYLLAPVVTYCPICGEGFVTPEDMALLKAVPSFAEAKKDAAATEALKRVRAARAAHFEKAYRATGGNVYPTRETTHMPTHRVVREVLSRPQYANLDMPTREMVREVLMLVDSLRPDSRGFVFRPDLVQHIVAAAWNYIQQRKAGATLVRNVHVTVEERVLMEIGLGLVPHVDLASTEGIPADILGELLKPYLFQREESREAVQAARENAHGQGKVKEAVEAAEKGLLGPDGKKLEPGQGGQGGGAGAGGQNWDGDMSDGEYDGMGEDMDYDDGQMN